MCLNLLKAANRLSASVAGYKDDQMLDYLGIREGLRGYLGRIRSD